ncbi:MAG TPA: hypothetical protein VNO33_01640 [Kofleriaceae bacterium]|nr:hypothetical protein [Kofleriaceae bacterium]
MNRRPRSSPHSLVTAAAFTALACGGAPVSRPPSASAPPPAVSCTPKPELAAIAEMVGEWRGDGWVDTPSGKRERFVQSEKIRCAVDGEVLLVEGLGHADTGGGAPGRIVHQALGVISYDRATAVHRMRAFSAGRPTVDSDLVPGEAGELVWGMTVGGNTKIRFRIRIAGGKWREIGEMSHQGSPWRAFLEMNLRRVDPAQAVAERGDRSAP